ncbi:hypothetical protein BD779DRAFT_1660930 [Infundibulicybe gibba]|nr:hypothetical protein BD779DRAFT_1660930 [Infundibulicybe gibba]
MGMFKLFSSTDKLPKVSQTSSSTVPEHSESITKHRRFSFRPFAFTRAHDDHKPIISTREDHEKRVHAAAALSKRLATPISSSDKRAKESALVVRSLIVGPSNASPNLASAIAKPRLNKIRSQLAQPKSANKVIAHLRTLPVVDETGADGHPYTHGNVASGPIHAVCLEHSDAEEDELHFAKLTLDADASLGVQSFGLPGVSSISLEKLVGIFNEIHIVDLIKSPDLGLGQPGDGEGVLAGAVPTAETVIKGIEQITPQLMALGFATGRAVFPDHKGVYPPTDRMSVLTYWWGLELVLPPPSLEYLSNAQSITGAIMNFLSALSLINNGVREILPFVRYIAQFIDFEFNSIRKQDRGQGVVCAATCVGGHLSDNSSDPSAIQPILPPPPAPLTPPDVVITSPTASAVSVPSAPISAAIDS